MLGIDLATFDWLNPLGWDWSTIIKTILSAGAGAGAGSAAVNLYRDRRDGYAEASSLAIRLATIFEAYASMCADFVASNEAAIAAPGEQYPSWETALPQVGAFPEDGKGWQSLHKNLASRVWGFPNEISRSQGIVYDVAEYQRDDLGDELMFEAATLGFAALDISANLRKSHNFPKSDSKGTDRVWFQDKIDHVQNEREQRKKRYFL